MSDTYEEAAVRFVAKVMPDVIKNKELPMFLVCMKGNKVNVYVADMVNKHHVKALIHQLDTGNGVIDLTGTNHDMAMRTIKKPGA